MEIMAGAHVNLYHLLHVVCYPFACFRMNLATRVTPNNFERFYWVWQKSSYSNALKSSFLNFFGLLRRTLSLVPKSILQNRKSYPLNIEMKKHIRKLTMKLSCHISSIPKCVIIQAIISVEVPLKKIFFNNAIEFLFKKNLHYYSLIFPITKPSSLSI